MLDLPHPTWAAAFLGEYVVRSIPGPWTKIFFFAKILDLTPPGT